MTHSDLVSHMSQFIDEEKAAFLAGYSDERTTRKNFTAEQMEDIFELAKMISIQCVNYYHSLQTSGENQNVDIDHP